MDIPTSAEIIEAIESFLVRHDNMAPTRFGREATGDQNLLSDLKKGNAPKLDRLHRIRDYMVRKDAERGFGAVRPDHVATDTAEQVALS